MAGATVTTLKGTRVRIAEACGALPNADGNSLEGEMRSSGKMLRSGYVNQLPAAESDHCYGYYNGIIMCTEF